MVCGILELWIGGVVELCCCGVVVFWSCGVVELWCCGVVDLRTCDIFHCCMFRCIAVFSALCVVVVMWLGTEVVHHVTVVPALLVVVLGGLSSQVGRGPWAWV